MALWYVAIYPERVSQYGGDVQLAYFMAWLEFRLRDSTVTYERDGHTWWRITRDRMAEELGVKVNTARGISERAIDRGLVVAESHKVNGWTDRATSYRLVCENPQTNICENPQFVDVWKSANVPSIKEEKHPPTPDVIDRFDEWWDLWPKKKNKLNASKKFKQVPVSDHEHLFHATEQLAGEWADRVKREGRDCLKFSPDPAAWLNGRRWEDYDFTPKAVEAEGLVAAGDLYGLGKLLGVKIGEPDVLDLAPAEAMSVRKRFAADWWQEHKADF